MELTVFQYGTTEITERMAFTDGDPNKKLPIALLFFLIETEGKKILVDAGCDTMPGFCLYEFQKPAELLEQWGVKREEITHVLLTHAHHDHIDGVRHYQNATVFLEQREWDAGQPYLKDCRQVELFEDEIVVTPRVRMKRVGGHSAGSCIVLVDDRIVLCGDECYTKENLMLGKPTGSSVCPENSLNFVTEYGKEEYQTILFHDLDLVGKIGVKRLYPRR